MIFLIWDNQEGSEEIKNSASVRGLGILGFLKLQNVIYK